MKSEMLVSGECPYHGIGDSAYAYLQRCTVGNMFGYRIAYLYLGFSRNRCRNFDKRIVDLYGSRQLRQMDCSVAGEEWHGRIYLRYDTVGTFNGTCRQVCRNAVADISPFIRHGAID